MSTPPNLLVTGAAGFLGSEVLLRAAGRGLGVTGTARQARGPALAAITPADILVPGALDGLMPQGGVVVHAAGLAHAPHAARDAFQAVNVEGTRHVMQSAIDRGVRRVVLVSSVAVYGNDRGVACDETADCLPTGPYAESKHDAEQLARRMAAAAGIELAVLRMSTIYGEADRGNIMRLVNALARGRFVWIGDGANRKSLVYKSDAADACLLAALHTGGPRCFNVSAPPVAMREIVEAISVALGRTPPALRVPAALALMIARAADVASVTLTGRARFAPPVTKWLSDEVFPADHLMRDLGWAPDVDVVEGLRRETDWFADTGGRVRT